MVVGFLNNMLGFTQQNLSPAVRPLRSGRLRSARRWLQSPAEGVCQAWCSGAEPPGPHPLLTDTCVDWGTHSEFRPLSSQVPGLLLSAGLSGILGLFHRSAVSREAGDRCRARPSRSCLSSLQDVPVKFLAALPFAPNQNQLLALAELLQSPEAHG